MKKVLLYFALKYQGDWDRIYMALEEKELIDFKELEVMEQKIDCSYVTIIDDDYPRSFKNIIKPPFVIFYNGNLSLLNDQKSIINIFTKNKIDNYLYRIINDLVSKIINNNKIIITGFESECEILINEIAAINEKSIIIISVGGFKNNNKNIKLINNNLIISEYPFELEINFSHINACNRLIAGISSTLLVLPTQLTKELTQLSNYFIEENKNIFIVPNQIYERGNINQLIKEGAKLVETIDDILFNM